MVTTKTLSVKQNNIDPAFETAKAEECTLSILYQQDGLSFLVRHRSTRQLYMAGYMPRADWSDQPVQDLIDSFPQPLAEVIYGVEAAHSVLIPQVMTDPEDLDWTADMLGHKANFSDVNESLGVAVFAYLPEEDLILSNTTSLVRRHHWALQLDKLEPTDAPTIWAHVYNDAVQIMASRKGNWSLINSFPCANESELIYHLGNCTEQLDWNRADCTIELSGLSARAYKEVVQPYFGTVRLFKPAQWSKISSAMKDFDALAFATLLRL